MTDDEQFLADLHAIADRAHASDPGAQAAPANTWQHVLATAKPETESTIERKPSMNTQTAQPMNPVWEQPYLANKGSHRAGRSIRRYSNLAATIALVLAVVVGGWLAMMQLQPSNPDPRFAVLPATPEGVAQTCDVEPLSADRVMEIVQNPAYFMANGPIEPRADSPMHGSPPDAELWEVDGSLELQDGTSIPSQDQFDSVSSFANEYVNCMVFGTQGQVWSFYSPVHLQISILAEFPVFSNESEVRARVEERLSEPAFTGEFSWEILPFIDDIKAASVNPDRELALLQASESSNFNQVIKIGVSFKDGDGKQIALTNGTGRDLIPNDFTQGTNNVVLYVTVVKMRFGDGWLIVPWASEAELGL